MWRSTSIVILLFLLSNSVDGFHHKNTDESHCGYKGCNLGKEDHLNVHLITHTHDDVGWLKTVDQYYYGARNHIQKAGVQYILDTVIQALEADPKRRFTYVEMAFFMRWWRSQSPAVQEQVNRLVQEGRLQFALGAWAMADEATVYYGDAIDQMTRGRDSLRQLFGACGRPRVAWQIDPFGHSRDHAELFRDSGFDAVYFSRMDYREKMARRASSSLEVLWDTGTEKNATNMGLFTGMFYETYCYPATFCLDDKCNDDPFMDDPELEEYNVNERVGTFLAYIRQIRTAFKTNHVMVMMGCDFTYENANMNFKNMDKLIRYVNERQPASSKLNVFYSTPACYTKAVNEAFTRMGRIERRKGDFFPYASGPSSYWTGYYTSRAALKNYVRYASNLLTMAEQIHVFSHRDSKLQKRISPTEQEQLVDELRRALGVMQHHDAVTGTEKQHVANDYAKILAKAIRSGQTLISEAVLNLFPSLTNDFIDPKNLASFCDLRNISLCYVTESDAIYMKPMKEGGVFVFVYNPTGWQSKSSWIRVPLYFDKDIKWRDMSIILKDMTNPGQTPIPYQLLPISDRTLSIPERHTHDHRANAELVFNAISSGVPVAQTGFNIFYLALNKLSSSRRIKYVARQRRIRRRRVFIPLRISSISKTTKLHLKLPSGDDPLTVVAQHVASGMNLSLTFELLYYYGETRGMQASGAYIFLPKGRDLRQKFSPPTYRYFRGDCVEEVHLNYTYWASLVVRLYNNGELEVEWTAGPIPHDGYQVSRELVVRYTVKGDAILPETTGEFFTDSAGRRLIRRVRNKRPDWNVATIFRETQPVAGNYYPILNRILLKGSQKKKTNQVGPAMGFAAYTDRAQGASSLEDGQIEIMLHRSLVRDDGFGVGEALMENGEDGKGLIVRGRHVLRLDQLDIIEAEDATMSRSMVRQPIVQFAPAIKMPVLNAPLEWSPLNITLPSQLHLLSLVAWPLLNDDATTPVRPRQVLVRLEHLAEQTQSASAYDATRTYQLDATYLLRNARITNAKQVTLTADQERKSSLEERLKWPTEPVMNLTDVKSTYVLADTQQIFLFIPSNSIVAFVLDYESI